MGKLIDFVTGKVIDQVKTNEEVVDEIVDGSIELSQHLINCLEDEIGYLATENHETWLKDFNMRSEQHGEARDMYVIINLLHAILLRYIGLEHELQQDMDNLYIKLKTLEVKMNSGKDNDRE